MKETRLIPQVGKYSYSMSDSLRDIDVKFRVMFRDVALKLRNFHEMLNFDDLNTPDEISPNDLLELKDKLERYNSMGSIYIQARTALWFYFYTHQAYLTCFKEGYAPFLSHVRRLENMIKNNPSLFNKKKMLYNEKFQEIIEIAKENIDQHPKFIDLKEKISDSKYGGYQKIIFANKTSAYWLRYMLSKHGLNTELITKERVKDSARTTELVDKLKNGKIKALIVTFAPKKPLGLNYPMIFHYQIPERKDSRVAKNDSAGSLPAFIYYLFLNHGLEQKFYYVTSDRKKQKSRKGELPFGEWIK